MLKPLHLVFLVLLGGALGAQTLHHPRVPRPDCPPAIFQVLPDGGGPVFSDDWLLGISAEWLVFQHTVDFSPDFEHISPQAQHIPSGMRHSTGLVSELIGGTLAYSTEGRFVFQSASESLNGLDLDGDGQPFGHHVLHTFDLETGTLQNLGLSVGFSLRQGGAGNDGPTLLFVVDEVTDENGDGDTDDQIAYAGDLRTGGIQSSGTAAVGSLLIDENRAAWLVREEPGQDLNGDGDSLDDIHYVHAFGAGIGFPLGLAEGQAVGVLSDGVYAFSVDEVQQGADLDGDGSQDDDVVHVFRMAGPTLLNVGIARAAGKSMFLGSGKLAVVEEATLHGMVVDVATGATTDLGLPILGDWVHQGQRLAFRASEGSTDRNGDGDTLDQILWIHDLVAGTTIHVPRASATGNVDAHDARFLLFRQHEASQGATDLNGDGDASDSVFSLFDFDTGAVRSLGWAAPSAGSFGGVFGDFVALSVFDPVLGGAWVNVRTEGPLLPRFIGEGALLQAFDVEGLGIVGGQYTQPPDERFLVLQPCF